MSDTMIFAIILQVVLISLNAIFACAEIAVISMNDNKLAHMAAAGDKRALRLTALTAQPAKFLATIQVAITLSGFMGSAFAADNFSGTLTDFLVGLGVKIPISTLETISLITITLILSYFTLVFGELVPKRLAMQNAEKLALGMSALISVIARIFAPLVWALTASTNGVLRLLGVDPNAEDEVVSEEEIRMMVDVGKEKGVIDEDEKSIIQNVFEFDDLTVGEFATHRTEVHWLELEEANEQGLSAWEEIFHRTKHTLYPVCGESVDKVVGILNVKDYFALKEKNMDVVLSDIVKPAYFVPEGVYADVLFKQMKKSRNHLAVVLDEYGGVVGIVTMNDLLEQLVGDLENRISVEDEVVDILEVADNVWHIRGSAELDEVAKILGVNLPLDDYDTFGGFVFGEYGSIPKDGSQFEVLFGGFVIKVVDIKDHRIEKIVVSRE